MMSKHVSYFISVGKRERSWGLYVTGAGHLAVKANEIYPPVQHPTANDFQWERGRILEEFALLYIIAGSGMFESAQQATLDLHAGDCILLFPGEWHRYRPEKAHGWEEYWVTFGGTLVESWRQASLIDPRSPLLLRENDQFLLPLFQDILRLTRQKSGRRHLESAALCHLLIARMLSAPKKASHLERKYEYLYEAGDYLRLHSESDVDLSQMAKYFGMSYSNFRRSFTRYFGNPPDRFHQQARVARAKQLLIETDLPLKGIAERLGYASEFYFMQVFKRHTGLTPTQWRHRRDVSAL